MHTDRVEPMDRRRGHHRHPRQPAGARGRARRGSTSSASSAIYCGGDLVGYGPHPNEVCALIQERGDPDDLRQLRLRDRPRPRGLRLRLRHPARPRARPAVGRLDARAHRPARPRTSCASCPSTCTSRSAATAVHLVHGSPRKVNEYLFEDKPARAVRAPRRRRDRRRAGLRPHPQAVGARVRRRAVRQLRLGRQAQGRRPARRVRGPASRRRPASRSRSSASPTTPRPSRARSPPPACRASSPTSCSRR